MDRADAWGYESHGARVCVSARLGTANANARPRGDAGDHGRGDGPIAAGRLTRPSANGPNASYRSVKNVVALLADGLLRFFLMFVR